MQEGAADERLDAQWLAQGCPRCLSGISEHLYWSHLYWYDPPPGEPVPAPLAGEPKVGTGQPQPRQGAPRRGSSGTSGGLRTGEFPRL